MYRKDCINTQFRSVELSFYLIVDIINLGKITFKASLVVFKPFNIFFKIRSNFENIYRINWKFLKNILIIVA